MNAPLSSQVSETLNELDRLVSSSATPQCPEKSRRAVPFGIVVTIMNANEKGI